ncbi:MULTISPECIES: DUF397 domain-containing protein [unclassified Streptomyces]|uniref:DUF397 domain-containing protein n=1 Tax=unclassified Streptomyces TaxID=2593676 RepID=UPI00224DEFC5|nr:MULTISPECIES: DUF397 domain-containing protein [unclassified Streptomyces]MCX5048963.1 DUF397 domain-containing protein [Streptomyces sp. NBC_00474]MCX5056297.1 DUF397 domain-containing protein [Streptomyces sp. NBC_00452]MCX5287402.1 DUF397 domain-containing protein [Streptomyces sp. NBC_00183]
MTQVVGPFWKSSYSGAENNCVEVADTAPSGRAVRDSKQQHGPLLTVSRDSWQAFIRQFG